MKISLITVVYNNEKTISHAIESVLNQDYPEIEYIVVDGASKDQTLAVINIYKDRITKIVSEPDKGMYDAMNKAIGLATGEVIGILNSDDLYAHNQVISHVMHAFEQDATLEIVYGSLNYVKADDTTQVVRRWTSMPYFPSFFEYGEKPAHPTFFVKKYCYNKAGVFRWADFKTAADYELMLRFLKVYQFKSRCLNEILVLMRLGGASNRSIKNLINASFEDLYAWRLNGLKAPFTFLPFKFWIRAKQYWAAFF